MLYITSHDLLYDWKFVLFIPFTPLILFNHPSVLPPSNHQSVLWSYKSGPQRLFWDNGKWMDRADNGSTPLPPGGVDCGRSLSHWAICSLTKNESPKEGWALKNWYFWTVVLEKTLQSPLDCKEIQPVNPKGSQSWIFIGRTDAEAEAPTYWPADAKSRLIGRDSYTGKDWRQKGKEVAEDVMVR